MNLRHLLRMSKWARNPPSEKKVKLVIGIVMICLILFAIERWIGVPDWLQMTPQRRGWIPS
ncbi:hypothetical protein JI58_05450 [Marinosulfonomonas sp. PRT-SC04]|nr:hypothetical protein JI58_05450 [Marinosulfonomonas sp. PRT-SC04]